MVFAVAQTISIIYKHHFENLHRAMPLLPASNFMSSVSLIHLCFASRLAKISLFFLLRREPHEPLMGVAIRGCHAKSVVEKPFLHPHFFCFAAEILKINPLVFSKDEAA